MIRISFYISHAISRCHQGTVLVRHGVILEETARKPDTSNWIGETGSIYYIEESLLIVLPISAMT